MLVSKNATSNQLNILTILPHYNNIRFIEGQQSTGFEEYPNKDKLRAAIRFEPGTP